MNKALVLIGTMLSIVAGCTAEKAAPVDADAASVLAASSPAFRPGCEGFSRQPMNLGAFKTVADEFSRLPPKAASRFLICTNDQDPGLAEALMLYQRRLRQPADLDAAFLHYVINTSNPLLADEDPDVTRRLERRYHQSLVLADSPDFDAGPSGTLDDLRGFGQAANISRYGRGDVVPTHLMDFDESADGYSHVNAVWMAEMSALAYWDETLVDTQLRLWQYELIAHLADEGTETTAYLAGKGNHLVLSFRGTSSLKDFKTDARILKTQPDWTAGKIHRGFAGALDSVWSDITGTLGRPGQQQQQIWITGHSLGAALAQLAALRLTRHGYRVRAVYTYGTPRIGNGDFAADYDGTVGTRTFAHINRSDLVTRVPPALLGFRKTARKQTLKFTGAGHAMTWLEGSPDNSPEASIDSAVSSIRTTTAFLPVSLQSPSLPSAPSGAPPLILYTSEYEEGPLDEHGSFQYLFKLACVAMEKELWPIEARLAGMDVGRLDFARDNSPALAP